MRWWSRERERLGNPSPPGLWPHVPICWGLTTPGTPSVRRNVGRHEQRMDVDGREVTVSGDLLQPLTRRTSDILRLITSAIVLLSLIHI